MQDQNKLNLKRRDFLKVGAISSTGLILGFQVSCKPKVLDAGPLVEMQANAYIGLNNRGMVQIVVHRSEMGQGVRTSLPMILADELEADWDKIEIIQAPGDEETYGNQNTDGSFSVRMFYEPLRKAGAGARMMLEQAAADIWEVDVKECKAKEHHVHHSSGKKLAFGELVEAAKKLEAPKEEAIKLKDSKDFKFIGKGPRLLDGKDMATGQAKYGLDTQIEGMQYAMIKRCPVVGGKIKSYDAKKAEAMPGVNKVFTLDSPDFPSGFDKPLGGVVVVADNTWAAWKALDAIEVEWEFGPNGNYDTDQYLDDLEVKVKKDGVVKRESGNVKQSLMNADQVLTAVYRIPHSSHSPMEPPCAVAEVKGNVCEIWAPTQNPEWVKGSVAGALATALEKKPEEIKVKVNVTLLGGGFGRKSKPDFVVEAAMISKEVGTAVKLTWKREHDVQHDFYHACGVQQIKVAIDQDNKVKAWNHQTIFPPIGGTASPQAIQPSDGELGLGFVDFPFEVENICCETNEARAHTRIGWVRSVSNIQHAFATCSMMDEIAEARQMDAIDNALDMLGKDRIFPIKDLVESYSNYNEPIEDFPWETARFRKVIEMVRDKSGWGEELAKGEAWGFAAHRSFLTYVAAVVKVKVDDKNKVTIPEVHYAVDCGKVINEERVKSQFEGGAVFGTSIALKSAITFKEGRAQQSNFNNFQVARHGEDPQKIAIYLVPSEAKPTGVGEPPVPPIAPAIANALYQITGKRHRTLPIDLKA